MIALECEVSDRDAEVTWFKDARPITTGEKYEILSEKRVKRILKIKKLLCTDEATYTCKVAKKTTECHLTVKPDVEFRQSLFDTKGIETKRKELEVRAFNPKKYPVIWCKEGVPIKMSDRISAQEIDDSAFLIFSYLEMDDTGMYSCRIGNHETKGMLEVQECDKPPSVDLTDFKNVANLKKGANFMTAIPFKGFPVPQVSLLCNGEPVNEKIKLKPVVKGNVVELQLDDAARPDTGKYELKLKNECGEVSVPLEVNVFDRPSPPKGPLELTHLSAKKCTLEWDPPEDDGGKPIKHYVVEKMDTADGQWKLVKNAKQPKCDVDLEEGKKYKFRVRAVNDEGESDNLETEKETLARDICDPPDSPTALAVEDYDRDRADLKWNPPRKDNGAPVTKYIIEAKQKSKNKWEPVKEVPSPNATVPLKEGEEYEFRVIAVNKAGKSEPSEATKPMIAKPRLLKPFIIKTGIKPIKVKVGEPVQLDLDYRGEPDPVATWSIDTKILENTDNIKLEFKERSAHLKIVAAQRKDTALYTLRVVNEVGEDQASIEVVALGKPSRPVGPLEVSDVTKNSAKLSWNKPEDDGGTPITHYVVEKMNLNRKRWEPVAEVPRGTSVAVPKLEEGQPYMFRVKAVSSQGESEPLETESETIAKNPFEKPGPPGRPEVSDYDRDHIDIKWEPPEDDGGAPIKGYHVERKEPKSQRWLRLTKAPQPNLDFTDDGVREGKEYEYRVIAVNEAGPGEPSQPSEMAVAKPSREAPKISLKELPLGLNQEIRLRAGEPLHMPVPITGAPKPTVTWSKDNAPLPAHARVTDEEEKTCVDIPRTVRGDSGQYRLKLSNDYGEDEATIKVIVMDKPTPPIDVEATDVYEDKCKVTWEPPKDDGGCPITDYIIERMEEAAGIWERVPGLVTDNSVAVRNLTKGQNYRFRVAAVNMIGTSEWGETKSSVLAKNPYDPPGPPENLKIGEFDRHSVTLTWKEPKDDGGNPIQGYQVEKRIPKGEWRKATQQLVPGTTAKITNVDEGQTYEFRVCAVNAAGPGEPSKATAPHKVKDPTYPPAAPENLNVDIVNKNGVKLSWQKPRKDGGAPITGYIIEMKKTAPVAAPSAATPALAPIEPARVAPVGEEGEAPAESAQPIEAVKARESEVAEADEDTSRAARAARAPADDKEEWVQVQKTSDLCAWIPMKQGDTGKFRVRAVNDEGPGEPSKATQPLTAVDQLQAPRICTPEECVGGPGTGVGGLKDVTLKAGQELHLAAAWFGHPKPTAVWTCGGKTVKPEGTRVKISDEPPPPPAKPGPGGALEQPAGGTAVLHVQKVRRSDGGDYELTLMNDQGQVKTSCHVEVLDVPGSPEGPLEATDVNADEITLKWKPPLDDGGQPVTNYILEKRPKGSDSWQKVSAFLTSPTATVKNLEVGKEYEFRVMAENAMGVSEPLSTEKAIKAKHPYDPPSGMNKPNVEDTTDDSVSLSWEPPRKGPTTGYIVEKRPKGGREWTKANPTNITGTNYTVKGLPKGKEFEFRVVPYNLAGMGEPSEPTSPVKVQYPTTPPKIGHDVPREVIAKVDEPFKIRIPYTGSPPDKVEVSKDGVSIPLEGGRFKVEVTPNEVIVTDTQAKKEDAGKYKVDLENEKGKDSVPVTVKVVGPPSAPKGPLEISNIKAESCTLAWNPPTDNGGAPISNYVVEKQNTKTGEWSTVSAFVRGTEFDVSGLEDGQMYRFRVRAANEYGTSEPLEGDKAILAENPYTVPGAPSSVTVADVEANEVALEWTKPRSDGGRRINGYVVEYKPVNSDEWRQTPGGLVKGLNTKISGLRKGEKYEFRVAAKNEAGVGEFGQTMRPVECKPKFTTADSPGTPTVEDVGKNYVDLTWTKPLKDGGARITGYVVEKRKKFAPDWEPATADGQPVSGTQAHLENLDEGAEYEFRVRAVNAAGPGAPSEPTELTKIAPKRDVPKPPQDLEVADVFADSCKLVWKEPEFDGGCPITDYIVEKCDVSTGNWERVPMAASGTTCPVRGLVEGKRYKFRVSAVNAMGASEPIESSVPITAKNPFDSPDAPEGVKIDSFDKHGVNLSWEPPKDDGGNPVKGYLVEKRTPGGQWVPATAGLVPGKDARITGLEPGQTYEFRVSAVNDAGPGRPSRATHPQVIKDPTFPPSSPEGLNAGQELRLAAAWFGHPKPTMVWTLNDKTVKPDGKNLIESSEPVPSPAHPGPGGPLEQSPGATEVLTVPKARRADSGEYKLTLMNDHGQATTSCKVEVIDVPGAPSGPLEATEVKADEITLQWKAPEDDGGEPITNYVLEKKPKNSTTWEKVSGFLHGTTATVRNLEEGKEYDFRVMAENAMGVSEPLTTDHAIKAKHPFDPPSGMDKPTVEDTTSDSVTLAWSPPLKGPVTGYVVEKRPKGDKNWTKANMIPVTGTQFTVKNLPTGKEFEFRVVPVNAAGPGEPSDPTALVKVQNPVTAPKIGPDAPKEVVAHLGEPCKIRIPYSGSPPDKVEMTKNGIPVPLDTDRFTVEVTPNEVIITDTKAEKEDAGPLQITLENEKGKATAPITLKVQGPPEPPKGPLEVTDVRGDSCKLSWNPPSDNGGSPITNYVVEKMDTKTGEWTPVSRFVRQPEYEVTGLEEGNNYKFRVRAENELGVSEPLEAQRAITAENPATAPDSPSNVNVVDVDADKVKLEWKKPRNDGGRKVTGYVVEYKPVNATEWERTPVVKEPSATVDGLKKGEKYVFRVAAKNEVGTGEPSRPTKPVECKPKYTTADGPGQPSVDDVGKNYVDLSWPKPLKDGGSRITGYVVEKRKKNAPNWEPATPDGKPVSGNQAHIDNLDENGEYEFRVRPVNAAGIGAPSDPTPLIKVKPKHDKPDPPEDVKVDEMYADHCTLSWRPPENDGGLPITSYIVEKCDATAGIWERVPTIISGNTCPIRDLIEGKRYRFRVTAVNPIGPGEPGEVNGAVTAKNPFESPDSPDHLNIDSFDKHSVDLSWEAPKHDGGNPIKGYLIEKRTPKGEWKPATTGLVSGTSAHLPGLETGQTYEFRVSAVNDAGPGRPSRATAPHVAKDPSYPASSPEGLNVDKVNKNGVKLSWQKPRKDGGSKITGYQVEKKDENGNWIPVKQTTEPCAFVPMKEGETGQFRVRAVNDEGPGEPSKPTAPITAVDQPEAPHIATPEECVGGIGSGVGGLKDITVKAGQDLKLPVAWFGHPKPTFTWTLNDKPVRIDGNRVKTTDENLPPPAHPGPGGPLEMSPGGVVVLNVGKVTRADKGRYQLNLSNELGQANTSCNVEVLDVPGSPGGPLEPTEVKADEITLKWKAPEDDGGQPVTNYILEKRVKGTDTWQKVSAFLKSPTATVRNLDEGKEYEFRVSAENPMGVSEPLTTEHAIKAKHPFDPPSGMSQPQVENTTDDSVTLSWDTPLHGPTTGYVIEKRAKGDRNWSKATPHPVAGNEYTVKGLPQGKEFEFRVVPVNAAGRGEPSEPTPLVKVQKPTVAPKIGRDAPREVSAANGEPFKIRIPYSGSPPDTVEVTKNAIPVPLDTDRFQVTITPDEVIITNKKAEKPDAGDYNIKLKNEKGEDSLPIKVKILGPPESPKGPLEVSDIKADSCTLRWRPPEESGGSPVSHYVVEKQDTATGEWVPISKYVRSPEYEVQGLDEGKKYKFRVRAANDYGVSEPLEVERSITAENPLAAPEAPGVPEVADVDSDSVTLEWTKPRGERGGRITGYVCE
ncbi:Twitchin [Fasciola gigantica]|uniref:Twitchin n=1 Tax=Fasciola gigantica TaxID=46835 RepID=A0A504Y6L4_FASGI|nr:Twitchin [Fasciola gigantica]